MHRTRARGKTIDYKTWFSIPGLVASVSTNTTTLSGGLSFSEAATILRIRGYVAAFFDETMQPNDRIILTFGLGIVSTDAFSDIGATAVPDPLADSGYPWLWWNEIRLDSFVTVSGTRAWGPTAQRLEVDTKAMRKVKPAETVCMVIETTSATGAPVTLIDIGAMRLLLGT